MGWQWVDNGGEREHTRRARAYLFAFRNPGFDCLLGKFILNGFLFPIRGPCGTRIDSSKRRPKKRLVFLRFDSIEESWIVGEDFSHVDHDSLCWRTAKPSILLGLRQQRSDLYLPRAAPE
jgi:hypothetical protein